MTYRIDPELSPGVVQLSQFRFADYATLRAMEGGTPAQAPKYEPEVPVTVRDVLVPGLRNTPDVRVRVYTPAEQQGERPGLLYIHGGGFVLGSVALSDAHCLRIAERAGTTVVSVDYRRAPDDRFPAAVEDCYAALVWTAENATELAIDPRRLGIMGESAGGGLAAAVTLMARDRGGPALCFQLLAAPEIDDRLDTPSMRAYHDTPGWNRPSAELSWDLYLGEGLRGGDQVSAYAAPARVENLSGLPPAFVTAGQFDPLRDEDINYAQRLAQAGVPTELRLYPGTFHGSHMVTEAAITQRMFSDQTEALRRGLRADTTHDEPRGNLA
ncbi:alpha/beta hydrolase [Streptomyces sp. NPDC059092]|uniref:alpha/beta hydrolase n=1 Tax=Streptomyces sp. NPDC059092 TaxID=3346725 RepID=UPI003677CF5C